MKSVMSKSETERYRAMQKPSGVGGPDEWLDLQKWYYATISHEIEVIEQGTVVVSIRDQSPEDAKEAELSSRRNILEQIAEKYLSPPD